jgi:hypothetical protein
MVSPLITKYVWCVSAYGERACLLIPSFCVRVFNVFVFAHYSRLCSIFGCMPTIRARVDLQKTKQSNRAH